MNSVNTVSALPFLNKNESMSILNYSRSKSSAEQIQRHLVECDAFFVPPLSSKVEMKLYSQKLAMHAVNFEAWNDEKLIGLVSVYLNDSQKKMAFISNVSIISTFAHKGIATRLLNECVQFTKDLQFGAVGLEVSLRNGRALSLYIKLGFKEIKQVDGIINLELKIN